jgi:hypothetical protein
LADFDVMADVDDFIIVRVDLSVGVDKYHFIPGHRDPMLYIFRKFLTSYYKNDDLGAKRRQMNNFIDCLG